MSLGRGEEVDGKVGKSSPSCLEITMMLVNGTYIYKHIADNNTAIFAEK